MAEPKKDYIKLMAAVVHAKDKVIAAAEALRDDAPGVPARVHDLELAVDAMRAAKKAAGV